MPDARTLFRFSAVILGLSVCTLGAALLYDLLFVGESVDPVAEDEQLLTNLYLAGLALVTLGVLNGIAAFVLQVSGRRGPGSPGS